MAKNMFGTRLDRNGYAPSILEGEDGVCWNCGRPGHTERHEVFGGALRLKSKALGLWAPLCPECHRTGRDSVENNAAIRRELQQITQEAAMEAFGWDMEDWMREFYKNHLTEVGASV